MVRLLTVNPGTPGWGRRRTRSGFRYVDQGGAPMRAREERERIDALAIPPAWAQVWIAPQGNAHIQAVGTDEAGRRQYIYHEAWTLRQLHKKFDRALQLAGSLPAARRQVTRDIRSASGSQQRSLAAGFRLLDSAYLRVGDERYAREHGSRGLTTLLCSHATVTAGRVLLQFPGKSGQDWSSETSDTELAAVIRSLKKRAADAPLLAWKNDRRWQPLHASDINDYVRLRTRGDFTAKDFRTLHGTIVAARALALIGTQTTDAARKKAIAAAVTETAQTLGNTPAVARGSYIDPRIFDRYRAGQLLDERSSSPEAALRRLLLGE